MRRALHIVFIIAIASWLLAPSSASAEQTGPTLKELLRQASEAFSGLERFDSPAAAARHEMAYHTSQKLGMSSQLLVMSWFIGNGRTVLRYRVTDEGHCSNIRSVFDWADQAMHEKSLTQEELNSLRQLLPALPKSDAEPPIGRTVHVSFQSLGDWRTETYDASTLPAQLEEVIKILGERFETKDRQRKKGN